MSWSPLLLLAGLVAAGPAGSVADGTGPAASHAVHTALEAAYPAEDSVHTAPVSEIRLRYTTAVQVELSAITVLGPDGQLPATPVDTIPGSGAREIGVRFGEPLASGAYTVEWRTAGPDSHVIRGTYGFMVDRPEPEPRPADTTVQARGEAQEPGTPELSVQSGGAADDAWGPGGLTLNWLFLVSVVGMVGVVAFRAAVLRPVGAVEGLEPVRGALDRRLTGMAWVVVVVALAVVPFRLGYQAVRLAGPDGSSLAAAGALLGLPWGSSWLLHVAAVALFLVGLLLARRDEPGRLPWILAGAAALLAAVVPALIGHSGGAGTLALVADALHVLAAGVWGGGLACLVLVGIPAAGRNRGEDGSAPALPVIVGAFSPMAVGGVALLLLSGVVNSLQHVALDQILTTPYGRLLGVKVLGALGAFALGFYNWRVVRPQLSETPRTRLIRIPAALELTLAACVLAVTAAVIVTAKP